MDNGYSSLTCITWLFCHNIKSELKHENCTNSIFCHVNAVSMFYSDLIKKTGLVCQCLFASKQQF